MKAVDSNVLVRYVTADDALQFEAARILLEEELSPESPGLLIDLVLVETCWVLRRLYSATHEELLSVVRTLLDSQSLVVDGRDAVLDAFTSWERHGGDFADALIARRASRAGATTTLTFDLGAVRHGMTLLERP